MIDLRERCLIDFEVIPSRVLLSSKLRLKGWIRCGERLVASTFNEFFRNPEKFVPGIQPHCFKDSDFKVEIREYPDGISVMFVYLPTDWDDDYRHCSAYAITYRMVNKEPEVVRLYILEVFPSGFISVDTPGRGFSMTNSIGIGSKSLEECADMFHQVAVQDGDWYEPYEKTYKDGSTQHFMRHMLTGMSTPVFCTNYEEDGSFVQSVTGYYDLSEEDDTGLASEDI